MFSYNYAIKIIILSIVWATTSHDKETSYMLYKFKTLFATVKLQVLHYTQVPETLVSSSMPLPNPKKILRALNCQTVYWGC